MSLYVDDCLFDKLSRKELVCHQQAAFFYIIDIVRTNDMNFQKYTWLRDLGSDAAKVEIAKASKSLEEHGVATFPNFLTNAALREARGESRAKADSAFESNDKHNIYLLPGRDDSLAGDHVRNRPYATQVASIAYDELDPNGTLARLYNTQTLANLVKKVTGLRSCYHSADPLGRCSVNVFKDGWKHAWHFDESEYSTTLMLQKPSEGGIFQYTKPLRDSQSDMCVDVVERVLDDSIEESNRRVKRKDLVFEEGTLSIFSGRRSLHRVTDCKGKTRLVAVFTFSEKEGYCNSESVQKLFWGRTGSEVAATKRAQTAKL